MLTRREFVQSLAALPIVGRLVAAPVELTVRRGCVEMGGRWDICWEVTGNGEVEVSFQFQFPEWVEGIGVESDPPAVFVKVLDGPLWELNLEGTPTWSIARACKWQEICSGGSVRPDLWRHFSEPDVLVGLDGRVWRNGKCIGEGKDA